MKSSLVSLKNEIGSCSKVSTPSDITSDDFKRYGTTIASLGLPTLFIMEGGYAVEEIGINTVNVLQGYEGL